MDDQLQTVQTAGLEMAETTSIRLTAGPTLLPLKILSSLPEIIRLEIEHPLFKDSGKQIDILNKIVRMLGVQFKDQKDRKDAGGEWVLLCQDFRLTAPEIVEAYRMALKKELKIFDENKAYKSSEYQGEFIKIFPNLSLITAGEILNAYIEHKRICKKWESGKKMIDKYLNAPPEVPLEIQKERRLQLWEKLKKSASENRSCSHAFLFYDSLVKKGYFKSFLGNENAQMIVIRNKMYKIILTESEKKKTVFSKNEIHHLKLFCKQKDYEVPDVVSFGFNRLKSMAIVEVKNDLVYSHVQKQLKKIKNDAGNEKPDSNLPEKPK